MSKNQIKSEKDWQKESDARTLMEAELIKASKERLKGAREAAKKIVTERQKEMSAMDKAVKALTENRKK